MIRSGCEHGIPAGALVRDERGTSSVERIVLVGVTALAAILGFRFFGGSVGGVSERQANCVATLGNCAGGAAPGAASEPGGSSTSPALATAPATRPSTAQASEPRDDSLQFVKDIQTLASPLVVVIAIANTGELGEITVSFAELFVRTPADAMLLAPWIEGAFLGASFAAGAATITSREVDKAKPGIKNVLCNGQFAAAPECRAK